MKNDLTACETHSYLMAFLKPLLHSDTESNFYVYYQLIYPFFFHIGL